MRPVWLWPNLLSLDAPVIAVLWQALFVRCFHVSFDALPAALLTLAVWLIYVADRTLDAWTGSERSARHVFYKAHWRAVLPVWTLGLGLAAWLAATGLPRQLFERGVLLLAVVGMYFAAVHVWAWPKWPKEAAVGALFALGASLAAWPQVRTVTDGATILLFSCLCSLNCVAIEKWETRLEWPVGAAAVGVAALAVLLFYGHRPVLGAAEMASAFAFLWLDRVRWRLSLDSVRVLADVALLSPVLFLPIAGSLPLS